MRQIGSRHAAGNALLQHLKYRQSLFAREAGIDEGFELINGQMQGVQNQPGRFVIGIGAAVTETQLGFAEAADRPAQPVADGVEIVEYGTHFSSLSKVPLRKIAASGSMSATATHSLIW